MKNNLLNMPWYEYLFALIVTFSICAGLVPLIIHFAKKKKVLDIPNSARKIHKKPTPLLGGLAIYFSFNIVMLLYAFFSRDLYGEGILLKNIIGITIGTSLLALGGFLDDKYNLKPKYQIIFPVLAIVAVIISGIGIDFIQNPFGAGVWHLDQWNIILFWYGGIAYKLTILADLFTFFWLLAMMYTTKLLDGLDGLVSGITTICGIFIFLIALNNGQIVQSDVALLAVILMGAFLGFLVYNFNPAKIFLGESGSTIAGFLLGTLSIVSVSKIGVTLMLLSIPALDVAWTIIRRIKEGKSPFATSDRKHLHHRLLDAGLSVKQAVLFLYSTTILFGILVYYLQDIGLVAAAFGVIAIFFFVLILGFINLKERKHGRA